MRWIQIWLNPALPSTNELLIEKYVHKLRLLYAYCCICLKIYLPCRLQDKEEQIFWLSQKLPLGTAYKSVKTQPGVKICLTPSTSSPLVEQSVLPITPKHLACFSIPSLLTLYLASRLSVAMTGQAHRKQIQNEISSRIIDFIEHCVALA